MQLPDLKDLSKVIDLCRKKGVSAITIGELKLEIREEAPPSYYKRTKQEVVESEPTELGLTEEDIMFYSARAPGDQ